MPSIKELENMLEQQQKLIAEMKKQMGKSPSKTSTKKSKNQNGVTKIPETSSKEIPELISKMNKTELKKLFGLDIGKNKDNPYKTTVKEFVRKYNIVSGTKWPVYLTYEHKHKIIKKLYGNKAKDICLNFLGEKLKTAKNEYVEKAIKSEIERWG